ncbi:MAG: amidohydrolase family protein [Spirochaetota bacterium]
MVDTVAGWGRMVEDGLMVLPLGVDAHVHLSMDAGLLRTCDDFESGSKAALRGGTGALVDFVEPEPGEPLLEALRKRRTQAAPSLVPVLFHMTISEWRDSTPDELKACVEAGIGSFKIYMAYLDSIGIDDPTILKVLRVAHSMGVKMLVHAEDGLGIQALQSGCVARGDLTPRFHALSRPAATEARAVVRLLAMVEELGGPEVVIAHVSSAAAMGVIKSAKARGLPVRAETCTQYLAFDASRYELPDGQGARYVMSPPLRTSDDVEYLWTCVADGTVDFIATDHCPFYLGQKMAHADDFMRIPNGVGGVAERMAFVLGEGHLRRNIPIDRLLSVLALNAAAFHGIPVPKWPADGGLPASYCLWDLGRAYAYKSGMGGSLCDYSIYEGLEFRALPQKVVLDGRVAAREWQLDIPHRDSGVQ